MPLTIDKILGVPLLHSHTTTDITGLGSMALEDQGQYYQTDQVDSLVATLLPLAGGTMDGYITLAGDPTNNLHAATKQYVDDNFLPVSGSIASIATRAHDLLTGLTDDDHTQYALLAGRGSGQTLIGGTGTTSPLVLRSTSGVGTTGADIILQAGNNGGTEIARFTNAGNVLIGITSAIDKVTIGGGGLFLNNNAADYVALRIRPADGVAISRIQFVGDGNAVHSALISAQTNSGAPTDSYLELQTMDGGVLNSKLRITDAGFVAIGGILTAPASILQLGGATATLTFGSETSESGGYAISVLASGGATPATKGTGYGRNLTITAGASDNTAGRAGGDLYLRPGVPTAPATAYGNTLLADAGGLVGIGTAAPAISDGVGLDINGKILRLRTSKTPASAAATGNAGEICWDTGFLYVCTATNSWERVAVAAW